MDYRDVVRNFAKRVPNLREGGAVSWRTHRRRDAPASTYTDGDVLYNYGSHFPLAKYCGLKRVAGKWSDVFVKNGDRYSSGKGGYGPTTAELQRLVALACHGPVVSNSALAAAGLGGLEDLEVAGCKADGRRPDTAVVVDYATDSGYVPVVRRRRPAGDRVSYEYEEVHTAPTFRDGPPWESAEYTVSRRPWSPPRQGAFFGERAGPAPADACRGHVELAEGEEQGVWHVMGAALIRSVGRGDFLCGIDEGRYFVSQLPRRCRDVASAFEALRPPAVRAAIAAGLKVARQGEWFFVPTGLDDAGLAARHGVAEAEIRRATKSREPLPDPRGRLKGNQHLATVVRVFDRAYARGPVRHVLAGTWRLTGEHDTCELGREWYAAYPNTEKRSWGMTGNFD